MEPEEQEDGTILQKGETSYGPLLAKVQPDTRIFPSDMLAQHQKVVRIAAGVLSIVFIGLVKSILSLF